MREVGRNFVWILALTIVFFLNMTCEAEAFVNPDGSVYINERNFPDENFREYIKFLDDKDCDCCLTKEERERIESMELDIDSDRGYYGNWKKKGSFCIKGIEYFPNLDYVHISGCNYITGTLKENKKLSGITLSRSVGDKGKKLNMKKVEQLIPLGQIKDLEITDYDIDCLQLSKATQLETLSVTGMWADTSIGTMNLSYNKKLYRLQLDNAYVKKVDLRKNSRLEELSVTYGQRIGNETVGNDDCEIIPGLEAEDYWIVPEDREVRLLLSKKNRIRQLVYFTSNRKVNLTGCKKLDILRLPKTMKAKVGRSWFQKRAVYVQKDDKMMWQIKIPKRGKYMYI